MVMTVPLLSIFWQWVYQAKVQLCFLEVWVRDYRREYIHVYIYVCANYDFTVFSWLGDKVGLKWGLYNNMSQATLIIFRLYWQFCYSLDEWKVESKPTCRYTYDIAAGYRLGSEANRCATYVGLLFVCMLIVYLSGWNCTLLEATAFSVI